MTTQNSLNNMIDTSYALFDFDIERAAAGGTVKASIINSDNSNPASTAYVKLESGGASAGDAWIYYYCTGTAAVGIDNSDSDAFIIARGSAPGTNNSARCDTAGIWTYPENACFSVNLNNVNQLNKIGNSGYYTIPFDTEIYDIGGNFNTGTYSFTAPVTGIYLFGASVYTTGHSALTYGSINIKVGATIVKNIWSYHAASALDWGYSISDLIKLTAGDAVTISMTEVGEAANTADIAGNVTLTYFTGALVA